MAIQEIFGILNAIHHKNGGKKLTNLRVWTLKMKQHIAAIGFLGNLKDTEKCLDRTRNLLNYFASSNALGFVHIVMNH